MIIYLIPHNNSNQLFAMNSSCMTFNLKSVIHSLILLVMVSSIGLSCKQKPKETESKADRICRLREEGNSSCCTEYRAESIGREIRMIEWEMTLEDPYWKGRPYETVIDGLSKSYNLNDYADFEPDTLKDHKTILLIHPSGTRPEDAEKLKWNKDDASKIRQIISENLKSDPVTESDSIMKWTAQGYDIEVGKNSSDNISLEFLTRR